MCTGAACLIGQRFWRLVHFWRFLEGFNEQLEASADFAGLPVEQRLALEVPAKPFEQGRSFEWLADAVARLERGEVRDA